MNNSDISILKCSLLEMVLDSLLNFSYISLMQLSLSRVSSVYKSV